MSNLGLDPDRLSSLDEHGHRLTIIPAEVRGFFRKRRDLVQLILILFFLILPWTKINGHQSVLLDIGHREFALFGIIFYAHDVPLIFFVLATLTLGLALVTAVWGRIWCGWACPQTVFIDGVYRRIERLIEGNYIERRRLEAAPLNVTKLLKRGLKWIAFILVSSFISHSFAAYFIGSQHLLEMMAHSPSGNWDYFVLITAFTLILLFDFGWFREQFCLIMCPYGRFQSVLLDSTSMIVQYDVARGEPRKGQVTAGQKVGDCVSCQRCVQVCPTGIDIRKGLQMECIACTACIDACDEIMTKLKKPKGLIRYSNNEGGTWVLKKPRAFIYAGLVFFALLGLGSQIVTREPLHWTLLRGQGPLYQMVAATTESPELVQNHLRLHIRNQSGENQTLLFRVQHHGDQTLPLMTPENPVVLKPGEDRTIPLFVRFPSELTSPDGRLAVQLFIQTTSPAGTQELKQDYHLLGPLHGK